MTAPERPGGGDCYGHVRSVRALVERWISDQQALVGTRASAPGERRLVQAYDEEKRLLIYLPIASGPDRHRCGLAIHGDVRGWPLELATFLCHEIPWLSGVRS